MLAMSGAGKNPKISVVVPIYNEAENVGLLYQAVKKSLERMKVSYEMVFVDDGSNDGSRDTLRDLASRDPHLRVVLFRTNFGQSAAMSAGFKYSRGEIVVTMDGDLQNDPDDIPRMIEKMGEGYDVVSGWRRKRKDRLILRKIPSLFANRLICSVTRVKLHDTGCSLKAFRREVVDRIHLYGELHRFLPALARIEGARISELVVNHRPRRYGRSKYNLTRTFRVLMDLSSLNLFLKHLNNPVRFFGRPGLAFLAAGLLGSLYVGYKILFRGVSLDLMNVLTAVDFLLIVAGFQFIFFGLVASLIVRTGDRKGPVLASRISSRNSVK